MLEGAAELIKNESISIRGAGFTDNTFSSCAGGRASQKPLNQARNRQNQRDSIIVQPRPIRSAEIIAAQTFLLI